MKSGPTEISVDYEYGDLKEVIVGVPFMIYPDLRVAKWVEEALKILPETEAKKGRQRSGKDSISIGKSHYEFFSSHWQKASVSCRDLTPPTQYTRPAGSS